MNAPRWYAKDLEDNIVDSGEGMHGPDPVRRAALAEKYRSFQIVFWDAEPRLGIDVG